MNSVLIDCNLLINFSFKNFISYKQKDDLYVNLIESTKFSDKEIDNCNVEMTEEKICVEISNEQKINEKLTSMLNQLERIDEEIKQMMN